MCVAVDIITVKSSRFTATAVADDKVCACVCIFFYIFCMHMKQQQQRWCMCESYSFALSNAHAHRAASDSSNSSQFVWTRLWHLPTQMRIGSNARTHMHARRPMCDSPSSPYCVVGLCLYSLNANVAVAAACAVVVVAIYFICLLQQLVLQIKSKYWYTNTTPYTYKCTHDQYYENQVVTRTHIHTQRCICSHRQRIPRLQRHRTHTLPHQKKKKKKKRNRKRAVESSRDIGKQKRHV